MGVGGGGFQNYQVPHNEHVTEYTNRQGKENHTFTLYHNHIVTQPQP